MEYIELTCRLNPIEPWREILIAQLADSGFDSFEETFEGFKAYVEAGQFNRQAMDEAMMLPEAEDNPVVSFEIATYKAENWNEAWEKKFDPVNVSGQLYIRAPFHDANPDVPIEIIIEPRMSFGTGHHETTRLVAMWLLEADMAGKSVLDMGCGTGILAILAAKKGAGRILAIDNYPFAYENTIDNVQRNGFPGIDVRLGDASLLGGEAFDVVLANITRNVLLEDMAKYFSVMKPGGELYLSGFLLVDKKLVLDHAFGLGLSYAGEKLIDDWVSLKLIKNT